MGSVDYSSYKINTLKSMLTERSLSSIGKKSDLIERLVVYDTEESAKKQMERKKYNSSPNDMSNDSLHLEVASSSHQSDVSKVNLTVTSEGSDFKPLANTESSAVKAKPSHQTLHQNSHDNSSNETTSLSSSTKDTDITRQAAKDADKSEVQTCDTASEQGKFSQLNFENLTEEDKVTLRKQKFGTHSDLEKRIARARRFDLNLPELENEKRKQRALRFGIQESLKTSSPLKQIGEALDAPVFVLDEQENDKRKKRALRFGLVGDDAKKVARIERFGLVTDDDIIARRKQRFGLA